MLMRVVMAYIMEVHVMILFQKLCNQFFF